MSRAKKALLSDLIAVLISAAVVFPLAQLLIRYEVKRAIASERKQTLETVVRALDSSDNESADTLEPVPSCDRRPAFADDGRANSPVLQN